MLRWLSIILLYSQSLLSQPNANLTVEVTNAYELVFSLRFQEANELITRNIEAKNENLQYTYLQNYIDYLTLFISEDANTFETLSKNKSDRLAQIELLPDTNPYKKYLIANINLQWALTRLKFGEYFTAALEFNRAYRAAEENTEKFPDFLPNQITLGAIHAMIGVVPDSYQWMLGIINMSGSIEQGKNELNQALFQTTNNPQYQFFRQEILFYLAMIEMNFYEKNTQENSIFNQIMNEDSDNLLLKYMAINMLMKSGKNDEAVKTFATINDTINYYPFYYLEYLKAECHLRALETTKAASSYDYFMKNFAGKNYLIDARRKVGWCRLISGDTTGYFENLEAIKNLSGEVGIDSEAILEAKQNALPNVILIQGRLLFDGGYYNHAQTELQSIKTSALNDEQKLELEYRMARIFDKTDQTKEAKAAYKKTIQMKAESQSYYAPNAALLLGKIYEAEADTQSAIRAYQQCLDMDFTTYRNSIQTKAKQQLKKLKKN